MTAIIEQSLQHRIVSLADAAMQGNRNFLQKHALQSGRDITNMNGEQWDGLRQLALCQPSGDTDVEQVCREARSFLPDALWSSVIVCGDFPGRTANIQSWAAANGTLQSLPGRTGVYLARLGMAALKIPPSINLLNYIGRLPGISFLGDGDRPVYPSPPVPSPQTPIGPQEAMVKCMMDGAGWHSDAGLDNCMVRVGVIDSGIDLDHPLLQSCVEARFDLSTSGLGAVDSCGHGTHVAGIIAGSEHPQYPMWAGVAPFAKLNDLMVADPLGTTSIHIVIAIGCVVEVGMHLYNLSMGSNVLNPDGMSIESQAVDRAAELGVLGCVAAGNDGGRGIPRISIPADASCAITVAAVDASGFWAPFSSMGPTANPQQTGMKPTVAAPGVGIVSLKASCHVGEASDPQMLYTAMDGTSMASPMIAGVCAIGMAYLQAKKLPPLPPHMITQALVETARDTTMQGPEKVGVGIPQIPAFLERLQTIHAASPKTSRSKNSTHQTSGDKAGDDSQKSDAASSPVIENRSGLRKHSLVADYREMEIAFVAGIKRNLTEYADLLVAELTGQRKGNILEVYSANEENLILDEAAKYGCLDDSCGVSLPVNLELRALLGGKRRKGAVKVVAKSFTGWSALACLSPDFEGLTVDRVCRFVEREREACPKMPLLLSLFIPENWPASVVSSMPSGSRDKVILCSAGNWKNGSMWVDVLDDNLTWPLWLCLTPMPFQDRLGYGLASLLQNNAIEVPGDTLALAQAANALQLPESAGRELLISVCTGDERFGLLTENGMAKYIKRKKVR